MNLLTPTKKKYSFVLLRIFLAVEFIFCLSFLSCRENSPAPAKKSSPAKITQAGVSPKSPGSKDTPSRSVISAAADAEEWSRPRSDERLAERRQMVRHIRSMYGFDNETVLAALENVPRHWFVPSDSQHAAYADSPLAIGSGQTISQPYIVAYMTALLDLDPQKKVLEIGTGSGYQAAVLSELTPHVYTIEIIKELADTAARCLSEHGYNTIKVKHGDGYLGWPEHAPFDAMIVTAAPEKIPQPLIKQLKPGGKMCIPVGSTFKIQNLTLITKDKDGKVSTKTLMPVRFVPFTRDPDLK